MNRDIIAFTKYKFNVYGNKDIRSGKDSAVVGIVGKSKSLDFPTMLIFWSLVRNSVVLAVYLLFSVACFLTVHEHCVPVYPYVGRRKPFNRQRDADAGDRVRYAAVLAESCDDAGVPADSADDVDCQNR